MKWKLICRVLGLIAFLPYGFGSGLDLLKSGDWKNYPRVTELSRGPSGELKIHVPVMNKKKGYTSVELPLPIGGRDLSEYNEIELTASADRNIVPFVNLRSGRKETLSWRCDKKHLSPAETTYSIPLAEMKKTGAFNPKQVKSVTLGFGLWPYDVLKQSGSITVSKLQLFAPADQFLIPNPTAGTNIDAEFKKDWGFENALYVWTPPQYVTLRGKKGLFARISFMYDAEKLYFLALVADPTPLENRGRAAYENDSIELFLASGVRGKDLQRKLPLAGNGRQIVFDAGRGGKATVFGKKVPPELAGKIKSALRKADVEVDGKMRPGYVLEAAIPWVILPKSSHQRGALLGYSLKIHDVSGETVGAGNTVDPHSTIDGYSRAYLGIKGAETLAEFQFKNPACDILWPERIGNGTVWRDTPLFHQTVDRRDRYFLNGIWAVQGASGENDSPGKIWYYQPIPGNVGWSLPVWGIAPNGKTVPVSYTKITKLNNRQISLFWFEREFFADPAWQGKYVGLCFDYIDREALVFLNGKLAGQVSNLSPRIDLSGKLQYGKWNRIDVRVLTNMEPQLSMRPRSGIAGDLYLDVAPAAPVVADLWVRKMQADGTFRAEVKLDAVGKAAKISLQLLSPDQKTLCLTERPAKVKTVFETKIKNPPLWSWEHPNLCTVVVRIIGKDGKLIEQRSCRIGFRTFESKNGKFLLNGKIIRLRTNNFEMGSSLYSPGRIARLKAFGFNAIYRHAHDYGWNEPIFDLLDENGFMTFAPTDRSASDAETAEFVRRYRNHPSVIGYVSDEYGMASFNGCKYNPFMIDDRYLPDSAGAKAHYGFLTRRYEFFRKLDPERFYLPLGTGNWKDHLCCNFWYPTNGFTLLDRMMFHAPWAHRKNPLIPRYVMEHGMYNLYSMDTTNPQEKMPARSIPSAVRGMKKTKLLNRMVTREAAGAFIGSAAFEDWLPWSKMLYGAAMRAVRLNLLDGYNMWHEDIPAFERLHEVCNGDKPDRRKREVRHFIQPQRGNLDDTWMRPSSTYFRSRANVTCDWGKEYGYAPTAAKPSIFHEFYANLSQPFCITITGEKENLFTLDHNYYGGETLNKMVTAVNDTDRSTAAEGEVTLNVGGRKVAGWPFSFSVGQGQLESREFSFKLPEVKVKTAAELVLICRNRKECFRLTLFPRPEKLGQIPGLGVIPGKFAVAKKSNLKPQVVDPAKPVPPGILAVIVEAEALKKGVDYANLEKFVNGGGRLLILEQGADSIYGFRAKERRAEFGFITDPASPVVAGLSDEDLSMWRGRAESVKRECIPSRFHRHGQGQAIPVPHLTNRNVIAGNVLDNPSFGNVKPIITGGYDRESALVLAARYGKGEVLFCEADVSPRYGIEPAATLLVNNLIGELAKPLKKQHSGVRYVGGAGGRKLLDGLGIAIVENSPVCAVGEGVSQLPEGCELYVALPGAKLPFPVKKGRLEAVTRPFFFESGHYSTAGHARGGILPTADDPSQAGPLFAGASRNDTFFFEGPELVQAVFTPKTGEFRSPGGTMGEVQTDGKRLVFCTLDPEITRNGEIRGKIQRVWSILFANVNVENALRFSLRASPFDFSRADWRFLTDPDGKGEATGFAVGNYGGRTPRRIIPGIEWEEQGVTEANPFLNSVPDSAYDGYAWYFLDAELPEIPSGDFWFHVNGIRDVVTFSTREQNSDLFINGKKMSLAGCWNAFYGGRGARLWRIPAGTLKTGKNKIAIRIYNNVGPGGIHKLPVRIEQTGKNPDMLFPYEFRASKYTSYFNWSW